MRKLADAMGLRPEEVPARWTALRLRIDALHHVPLGMEAKTLANHIANVKAALAWFAGAAGVPKRGAPLSAAWAALQDQLAPSHERKNLFAFMRWCSAAGIVPDQVDEATIDSFMAYRAAHTRLKTGIGFRRSLARCWNSCIGNVAGWPETVLVEPPLPQKGIRLDELPAALRDELERYLSELTKPRRTARGKRLPACKPSTISPAAES